MKKVLVILIVFFCGGKMLAQDLTPEQYIEKYKDIAISEMRRMGVPASITLAQGLLETENGNSDLLKKSNNHFGIKCKSNWTGEEVYHDDDLKGECFRSYKDADESYRDHSNFLKAGANYSFLFKLDPADYKAWAYGLKKAGYATNPKYPAILIKNIEQYNLQQYSLIAMNAAPEIPSDTNSGGQAMPTPESGSNPAPESFNESTSSVNHTKCMFAKKGTSLLAIASKNDIPLSKLMQFNELTQDGLLEKDQLIFLEKKPSKGATEFYLVKEGETAHDVAQCNGVQLEFLLAYNRIDKFTKLEPGTRLYLQNPKPSGEAAATRREAPAAIKYHAVQPKEGLYTISKKYGVSVEQIKQWNNLSTDSLNIGQQLIVTK